MNKSNDKRYRSVCAIFPICIFLLFFASFFVGRYTGVNPINVPKVILHVFFPNITVTWTDAEAAVILYQRLPRIVASLLIGASLAVSGAAYQALFANPVASSDTLGVTNSASFGAVLAILMGFNATGMKVLAFILGCCAVLVVYYTSLHISNRKNTTLFLLLIGMVISSLFSALLSILKVAADPENELPQITYWLMGSLSKVKLVDIPIYLPFFSLGMMMLFLLRWRMNLLSLSDYEAQSIGENTNFVRTVTILGATILTAAATAMTGGINWVGLIIPHLARIIVGNDMRRVLPVSAMFGGFFLLFVDNLARSLTINEIPISVMTSLIGAPVFFVILIRKREDLIGGS